MVNISDLPDEFTRGVETVNTCPILKKMGSFREDKDVEYVQFSKIGSLGKRDRNNF